MRIIHETLQHHPMTNRSAGLMKIDNVGQELGFLEYFIEGNFLHVTNLANCSGESFSGVGTALMNKVLLYCMENNLGVEFEPARGSEYFYKSWLKKSFKPEIDARAFDRIANKHLHCKYKHNLLKQFCVIKNDSDPVLCVKKVSELGSLSIFVGAENIPANDKVIELKPRRNSKQQ